MPDTEKTIEQIREQSNKSHKDFLEELRTVRAYQERNNVVQESYGGLVIDIGNNQYKSKSALRP